MKANNFSTNSVANQSSRRPLTQREIDATGQRIRNIVGDAARDEFSDDEFNKWSEHQVDRTTDINGSIVDKHIEPFKPEVKRQDLNLDGSVGDKADRILIRYFTSTSFH